MLRLLVVLLLSGMSLPGMAGLPQAGDGTAETQVTDSSMSSGDDDLLPLPVTRLFVPLRADPKEPRFFASFLRTRSDIRDTTVAAVGFGENFGVVRHGADPENGWQLGISAAVFAQFDMETPSSDLMNADYTVGIPLTWRRHRWSGRTRIYHQSSHLGDEYILGANPQRINLSFESIEMLAAYDLSAVRVYGGGEYLFHREPEDLAEGLLHAGVDWRGRDAAFRVSHLARAHWVAGVDVKRWLRNDWGTQVSAKAGLEFSPNKSAATGSRRWSLMMEFFDGTSPYGQFYRENLRYLGLAIQLGL